MEKSIIIAGYGGQGVLFFGTILAQAAMTEGKFTTWIPSYGAEMRGGHANCSVKISDNEIASPIIDYADYGIFLNDKAMEKFEKSMAPNALVIGNSSIIEKHPSRADVNYLMTKLGDAASEIEGGLLNIVTLGYFIKKTNILKKESVLSALEFVSKKKNPAFLKRNIDSFEKGYNLK